MTDTPFGVGVDPVTFSRRARCCSTVRSGESTNRRMSFIAWRTSGGGSETSAGWRMPGRAGFGGMPGNFPDTRR